MHFCDTHHMRSDSVSDEMLSCLSAGARGSTALHVMLASPRDAEEEEAQGGLQPYSTSRQVILAVVTKNHFPLA